VLDGVYLVSAKGIDSYGQAGTAKAATLVVNRRVPYPPQSFHAGRNDGNAYLEWTPNSERDIEGYHVYRKVPGSPDQLVCNVKESRCTENGMPAGALHYTGGAAPPDSAGNSREGQATNPVFTVPATNTPPVPPTVTASKSGQNTVLQWTASTDPDAGDSILYYRIYRDGTNFITDLYDGTGSGSQLTYTDSATNDDIHTYWVVAVDSKFAESRPLGAGVIK
jgi:hypothetical protein